ncbi:MAG: hypothetical protein ACRCZE_01480 [Candidatus Altimarinota bacterium]
MRNSIDSITNGNGNGNGENGSNGQRDLRVEVRFGFLTREQQRISEELVLKLLRNKVERVSADTSLKDLIEILVTDVAYRKAKLTAKEIVEAFEKAGLSDLIAGKFLLYYMDEDQKNAEELELAKETYQIDDQKEEEIKVSAKKKILEFLDKNRLSGSITFFEFLNSLHIKFPYLKISELLIGEVEIKLIAKIREGFPAIARSKYKSLYEEDKKGFVMGYMMGRVIKFDQKLGEQVFDSVVFRQILEFVDQMGDSMESLNGESLYDLLYKESKAMANYVKAEQIEMRRLHTRSAIEQTGLIEGETAVSDELFFDENFDVGEFYQRNIVPSIFRFNSKKLDKLKKVRYVDLLDLSPQALRQTTFSIEHLRMLKNMVDLYDKNPQEFFEMMRFHLGFDYSPRAIHFKDISVRENMNETFDVVKRKIGKNIEDALEYRELDDPIRVDCRYIPEIINSCELVDLMRWVLHPEIFRERFPLYKAVSDQVISHQCKVMLQEFLMVDNMIHDEAFQQVELRRELLEDFAKTGLKIREERPIELKFRLMEQVTADGEVILDKNKKPNYWVAFSNEGLEECHNGLAPEVNKEILENESLDKYEMNGEYYKVYPVEEKNFTKVKMTVPFYDTDEKGKNLGYREEEIEMLIYSAKGRFVDSKDILSNLLSQTRGKQISDENRWMLAYLTERDEKYFKEFLYGIEPHKIIKVEDAAEGRNINRKSKVAEKVSSSAHLKGGQDLAMAKKLDLVKKAEGKAKRKSNVLETLVQSVPNMLSLYLSDNSVSAHPVYRATRAWSLMGIYFNPQVWGDKYQEYKNQGFDYQASTGKRLLKG